MSLPQACWFVACLAVLVTEPCVEGYPVVLGRTALVVACKAVEFEAGAASVAELVMRRHDVRELEGEPRMGYLAEIGAAGVGKPAVAAAWVHPGVE